jgi:hypothetical protein
MNQGDLLLTRSPRALDLDELDLLEAEHLVDLLERELREAKSILEPHHPRFRETCRSIRIHGPPRFTQKVEKALALIASTRTGQKLLRGLDQTGRHVRIRPSLDRKNHARPIDRERATMDYDGFRGPGTSAIVRFDPDQHSYGGGKKPWMRRPAFVGLFHELIHASDYMHGSLAPGRTRGKKNCELSAVGLPYDHDGDPTTPMIKRSDGISENDLRAEIGLPKRMSYGRPSSSFPRHALWSALDEDPWLDL